jgi:hypothetical protein
MTIFLRAVQCGCGDWRAEETRKLLAAHGQLQQGFRQAQGAFVRSFFSVRMPSCRRTPSCGDLLVQSFRRGLLFGCVFASQTFLSTACCLWGTCGIRKCPVLVARYAVL